MATSIPDRRGSGPVPSPESPASLVYGQLKARPAQNMSVAELAELCGLTSQQTYQACSTLWRATGKAQSRRRGVVRAGQGVYRFDPAQAEALTQPPSHATVPPAPAAGGALVSFASTAAGSGCRFVAEVANDPTGALIVRAADGTLWVARPL